MAESVVAELRAEISQFRTSMREAANVTSEFGKRGAQSFNEVSSSARALGVSFTRLDADVKRLNLGAVVQASNQLTTSFHVSSQAINSLTNSARANSQAFSALTQDMAQFRAQLQQVTATTERFGTESRQAFRQAQTSVTGFGATLGQLKALLLGLGLTRLAREALALGVAFASAQRTLNTVTGSARAGAEAFAFVRAEAQRLGTDVLKGAQSFATFTNAARNTKFEGEGVRDIYTAMSEASVALGRSNEEFGRIMLATGQIITKGKIQTEELLQLTEAGIPIFSELSEALGITGEQLSDALRQGLVPAEALLVVGERLRDRFFFNLAVGAAATETQFRALRTGISETIGIMVGAAFQSDELNRAIRAAREAVEEFRQSLDVTAIRQWIDELIRLVRAVLDIPNIIYLADQALLKWLQGLAESGGVTGFVAQQIANLQGMLLKQGEAAGTAAGGMAGLTTTIEGAKQSLLEFNKLPDLKIIPGDQLIDLDDTPKQVATALEKGGKEGGKKGAEQVKRSYEEAGKAIGATILKALSGGESAEEKEAKRKRERAGTFDEQVKEFEEFQKLEAQRLKVLEKSLEEEIKLAKEAAQQRVDSLKVMYKKMGEQVNKHLNLQQDAHVKDFENFKAAQEERIRLDQEITDARRELFENAADNLTEIFERMADDDWAGTLHAFFGLATDGLRDMGKQFAAMGEKSGSSLQKSLGAALGKLSAIAREIGVSISAGIAVAQGARQLGANRELGGALGGATAGGSIGNSVAGIYGAVIGAAVGAIAGAIAGAFGGGGPSTVSAGIRTDRLAPAPGEASDDVFRRSPFGVLSFPREGTKGIAGFSDLQILANLDNAIAALLNAEQKLLATEALSGTITGEIKGEDFGNAAGAIMAERVAQVLTAAIGGQEGQVVGERFRQIDPRGTVESVSQLAGEFFGILQQLTMALDTEQLNAAEQAVRAVNEQFAQLRPAALDFGFSAEHINAAHLSALAKLREAVDKDVASALLAIKDPFAASMQELETQAQDLRRSVVAVGGDMAAFNQLLAAQRQELIAARNDEIKSFHLDLRVQLLSLTNQQAAAELQLAIQRDEMIKQALALGASEAHTASLIADIVKIYQTSVNQLRNPASVPVPRPTRAPARAQGPTRAEVNEQIRAFVSQTRSDVGRSLDQLRTRFVELTIAARRTGASTRHLTQSYNQQVQAQREAARDQVIMATLSISDPFQAALRQMEAELKRFRQLASEGIIPKAAVAQLARLARPQAVVNEALRQAGGAQNPIDQLGDIFQGFIRAGSPFSDFQQRMNDLSQEFMAVSAAARVAGLSTAKLEASYVNQARIIRQDLIKEIDAQLEAQRDGIRSINEYLAASRLDKTLPTAGRLDEARAQFLRATGGTDAGAVIEAAEAFKDVAREQFASGKQFFHISSNVDAALRAFRDREQARVENERKRQIQIAELQLKAVVAQTNSLTVLRGMGANIAGSSRQLAELVTLASRNGQQNAQLEALLRRTLARLETAVR